MMAYFTTEGEIFNYKKWKYFAAKGKFLVATREILCFKNRYISPQEGKYLPQKGSTAVIFSAGPQ